MTRWGTALAAVAIGGCTAGSTAGQGTDASPVDNATTTDTAVFTGPWVATDDNGDGTFTTTVVAVSTVDTVYFSFANGEVGVGTSPPAAHWDLAFQREHILINGGISGDGGVEAAELAGIAFDAVRWAPVDGWAVDEVDADGDGEDEEVLYSWFIYDYDKHILDPSFNTYVVRSPDGDVRLWVETYYNLEDGNSGYPRFHWAWLGKEPGPLTLNGDRLQIAPDAKDPVRIALREFIAVAPPDPSSSDDWDIAVQGATVALNGGVSGVGKLTATSVAEAFEAVVQAPEASSFTADAPDADADGVPEYALAGALVEDPKQGSIVAADLTWVVARPSGTWDKIRFEGDGDLIRTAPLE